MDSLTFITQIVKALAWPLTVLGILWVARQPLLGLIPLLRRLEWKDLELEFERQLLALASEAAQALPSPVTEVPDASVPGAGQTPLTRLTTYLPRLAILEAWSAVERAAADALIERVPEAGAWSEFQTGPMLTTHGLLDRAQLRIYNGLRQLRNLAAYAGEFPLEPPLAGTYTRIAEGLSAHLGRKGRA